MANFEEVRDRFVADWGAMGSHWGINRTMAMIHAFLMVSPDARDTGEIMESLQVSRGNANTNLRELVEWGLVQKVVRPGERREFFVAEKDPWKLFCTIARQRMRREMEPTERLLRASGEEASAFSGDEAAEFRRQLKALEEFVVLSNSIVERLTMEKRTRIFPRILRALKLA